MTEDGVGRDAARGSRWAVVSSQPDSVCTHTPCIASFSCIGASRRGNVDAKAGREAGGRRPEGVHHRGTEFPEKRPDCSHFNDLSSVPSVSPWLSISSQFPAQIAARGSQ
jgi:hypothetical protein